jgi:hypothetical protein
MEKLENKLIDMRDLFEERREKNVPLQVRVPTYRWVRQVACESCSV